MKAVHIATLDNMGGAAIATRRLSDAMRREGVESSVVTLSATPKSYSKVKYPILSLLHKRCLPPTRPEYGLFSMAHMGYDVTKLKNVAQADVIYIHWINDLLSLKDIERILALGKPVIVFLHDMWHLTGGCHHSFGCDGYTRDCSKCPMFVKPSNAAKKQLSKKIKIFARHSNVTVVTPSNWLTGCAAQSTLFQTTPRTTIPNCIDTAIFKQVDRLAARRFLNLPQDRRIICFGAHKAAANPYKGWSYLHEALKEFSSEDFVVLIFGAEYDKQIADSLPFEVHFTGYAHDEYTMALIYNAIDLFVMPSLAEAFGMVAVEALACGAGTVGFDIGGIPDIIQSGQRGYLARYKDSADLATGIRKLLTDPTPPAHDWVEQNCSFHAVAKQHIELWRTLK